MKLIRRYQYDKKIGRAVAVLIILLNIYLLKWTYLVLKDQGGPMGFGLFILPVLFTYHFFLITSIKEILSSKNNFSIFTINCLGLVWILTGVVTILVVDVMT